MDHVEHGARPDRSGLPSPATAQAARSAAAGDRSPSERPEIPARQTRRPESRLTTAARERARGPQRRASWRTRTARSDDALVARDRARLPGARAPGRPVPGDPRRRPARACSRTRSSPSTTRSPSCRGVRGRRERRDARRCRGDAPADALRALLAEALYRFDTDGLRGGRGRGDGRDGAAGGRGAAARLWGETADRERHTAAARGQGGHLPPAWRSTRARRRLAGHRPARRLTRGGGTRWSTARRGFTAAGDVHLGAAGRPGGMRVPGRIYADAVAHGRAARATRA